jgi:hypothetical protein
MKVPLEKWKGVMSHQDSDCWQPNTDLLKPLFYFWLTCINYAVQCAVSTLAQSVLWSNLASFYLHPPLFPTSSGHYSFTSTFSVYHLSISLSLFLYLSIIYLSLIFLSLYLSFIFLSFIFLSSLYHLSIIYHLPFYPSSMYVCMYLSVYHLSIYHLSLSLSYLRQEGICIPCFSESGLFTYHNCSSSTHFSTDHRTHSSSPDLVHFLMPCSEAYSCTSHFLLLMLLTKQFSLATFITLWILWVKNSERIQWAGFSSVSCTWAAAETTQRPQGNDGWRQGSVEALSFMRTLLMLLFLGTSPGAVGQYNCVRTAQVDWFLLTVVLDFLQHPRPEAPEEQYELCWRWYPHLEDTIASSVLHWSTCHMTSHIWGQGDVDSTFQWKQCQGIWGCVKAPLVWVDASLSQLFSPLYLFMSASEIYHVFCIHAEVFFLESICCSCTPVLGTLTLGNPT